MKTKKSTKKERLGTIQSDFVNIASHQLRTPLSGMRWLIELLQEEKIGPLNKRQKEYLEKIHLSNERMIALVNDLLEVTRLDQGQIKLYIQPTDLAAIIRELVKEKAREIKSKRVKVSLSIAEEPFPLIRTEPNKIKQALVNIIANAIAYTPAGGEVHIELEKMDDMALLKVRDTGVGIPKDEHAQVFNRFFRGRNVQKSENIGTGLGLHITKAFITASQGKIWFSSEEGKGTTFFVALPYYKKI